MDNLKEILYSLKPEYSFENEESFFEDYLFDSVDIIQLVVMIEEGFGIEINQRDIIPDNFESVNSLYHLIKMSNKK